MTRNKTTGVLSVEMTLDRRLGDITNLPQQTQKGPDQAK